MSDSNKKEPAQMTTPARRKAATVVGRIARWCLGILFFLVVCAIIGIGIPGLDIIIVSVPALFAFGWINYLARVVPEITWNLSMIASSLVVLAVAVGGLHAIARHFRKNWRVHGTLACTGMFGALFAAAIAVSGVFHQAVWLAKGDILGNNWRRFEITNDITNARQIMLALKSYEMDTHLFPTSIYELYPDYITVPPQGKIDFWQVTSEDRSLHEWLYYPEAKDLPVTTSTATKGDRRIVLAAPVALDGRIIVGFVGGGVDAMKLEPFLELFSTQQTELLREAENEQQ